jgi:hypothetical protein
MSTILNKEYLQNLSKDYNDKQEMQQFNKSKKELYGINIRKKITDAANCNKKN